MKIFKKLSVLFVLCTMFFQSSTFATKYLNIAFVGNLGSGKTQLRVTSIKQPFNIKRDHTLWTSSSSHPLRFGTETLICNLFDTSGNQKVKNAIILSRLKNVHIAVITVDSSLNTSDTGFENVIEQSFDEWVKTIRQNQPRAYILLAVTKKDSSAIFEEALREECEHLKGWYKHRFDYVFTSAKTGEGLGNSDSADDFGNNFWGKIRNTLKSDDILLSSLPEWDNTREFKGESDDSTKKCTIL